jgi:hypothetical protein
MFARQSFYHLSHTPSPFALVLFHIGSCVISWSSLAPWSSYLCLLEAILLYPACSLRWVSVSFCPCWLQTTIFLCPPQSSWVVDMNHHAQSAFIFNCSLIWLPSWKWTELVDFFTVLSVPVFIGRCWIHNQWSLKMLFATLFCFLTFKHWKSSKMLVLTGHFPLLSSNFLIRHES